MVKRVNSVDDLSDAARHCRAFSHSWKPYTATPTALPKKVRGYNVTLICDSCSTFKHFFLSQRGEYGSPHYTYDRDYLLSRPLTSDERNRLRYAVLVDSGFIPSMMKGKPVAEKAGKESKEK